MATIELSGGKCKWNDEKLLLDFTDTLSNQSAVPMHRPKSADFLSLQDLFMQLIMKAHREEGEELAVGIALTIALLMKRLIRTALPARVLEYGCGNGWLSQVLAELSGTINEDSLLVCAYDSLDECSMGWMERIADVVHPPRINYLAGDFGALELPERSFGIVVVNGASAFAEPERVVRDACRLAAEAGLILCFAQDEALYSAFRKCFRQAEEYEVTANEIVLLANAGDAVLPPEIDAHGEDCGCLERARALLNRKSASRAELAEMERQLRLSTRRAAERWDLELKIALLETKAQLIERIVSLK